MLLDFQKHIDTSFSFLKNKKLLVTISGGVDSVVLTHLLFQLKFNISLAHCNFHLRGKESSLDEKFVEKLALELKSKFFVKSFETKAYAENNNISIQMAARELRYTWFDDLLKKESFDYLITAHHLDDNLETFLINFSRGTGLDGLTGIPAVNNNIIRPLLLFNRIEIENYANNNKILWREDLSNAETKYLRNKLRHDIIPLLKELNPNFLDSFTKTIENLKASKEIISDRITTIKNQVIIEENGILKFNIGQLHGLNNTQTYLFELLKIYGFTAWNDIMGLLSAQSGKQVYSKTHRIIKDRDFLILSEISENEVGKAFEINEFDDKLGINGFEIEIKNISKQYFENKNVVSKNRQIVYIDKSLLKFPLKVRKWQNGDYFYPLGMQGKKKLSKYFKEIKLSLFEKENIWLICSEDKIVWVIDNRLDNRFKITDATQNILKIKIL
ncbi:MAG: tRNA lysidine(34) synthetase TilS [Flavobacteriaceae bacterium]|nr:tRNA lysidine(34) synthetase TilS [Flavobacteriaceae bacterium]